MTHTAIAADFHQTLDVQGDFAAQIAFHLQVVLDVVAQLADVVFGEILDAGVGVNADFRKHLLRGRQANTVDVGQADLNALFSGQVHTCNACHVLNAPP